MTSTRLAQIIDQEQDALLREWLAEITANGAARDDLMPVEELREQCARILSQIREASANGNVSDLRGAEYAPLRDTLAAISRSRAAQGFSPSTVTRFVLSLKRPLFTHLRRAVGSDVEAFAQETWAASDLLDSLALLTSEAYQKGREEVIAKQQQDMLELSTPVVKLWDGVLALPVIGTLDSVRTQVVMESLLQKIVETGCEVAIIDITGVPTVDTLVAQHLIKTVTAARLMGADCIISGIRPQIAQTIVHLGVDLASVATKATLADAFKVALRRSGLSLVRAIPERAGAQQRPAMQG